MTERLKFPDEPIRPRPGDWDFPASGDPTDDAWEDFDPDNDGRCTRCAGDGFEDCDGSGADDGEDICVRANPHVHNCGACGGSGDAKDQTVW